MNDKAFDLNEFIRKDEEPVAAAAEAEAEEEAAPELDVQKAVVESLAEDKAKLDEALASKTNALAAKTEEVADLKKTIETLEAKVSELQLKAAAAEARAAELSTKLAAEQSRQIDLQERNPNALALLDRDVELPDRFPGESRDHVLEVIKEARDRAEAEGRLRRAQVLEAVLVANEPNGTLEKERAELEKLFNENGNILSGPVLEELAKKGIPHKNGEEYLLPAEIIKRTF